MRVVGVCGSLQRVSANRAVLEAVAAIVDHMGHQWVWSTPLDQVPHFNPDLDPDDAGPALASWRADIAAADAVVIASPEYAHSLPGSLKNALDWLVGGGELYDRPVGLASAGLSGGRRALDALAQTLAAQGAEVVGRVEIDGVRPKLDAQGALADAPSLAELRVLVDTVVTAAARRRA